tara:strand:+ start:522 stop:839 length:318 start_codon:yes stop_codon:yes gene_type:complete
MSGPFKMKGSSGLGYGNQHSEGKAPGKMMGAIAGIAGKLMGKKDEEASPAKNTPEVKVDMNDPKVKANYDKYKNNKDYRKALNKKAGGKFDYDKKSNTSTTRTDI